MEKTASKVVPIDTRISVRWCAPIPIFDCERGRIVLVGWIQSEPIVKTAA